MRWCIGALTVLVAAGIGVGIYAAATGLPDVGFVLVLLSAAAVPAGLYWVRKPRQWGKPRPSGSEHEDVAEIPHGQGLITVHRPAGYPHALLRAYKVEIDGRVVAEVRRGESASVSVPAGEHAVRARIDLGRQPHGHDRAVSWPASGVVGDPRSADRCVHPTQRGAGPGGVPVVVVGP